jgi:hypothetical protein
VSRRRPKAELAITKAAMMARQGPSIAAGDVDRGGSRVVVAFGQPHGPPPAPRRRLRETFPMRQILTGALR